MSLKLRYKRGINGNHHFQIWWWRLFLVIFPPIVVFSYESPRVCKKNTPTVSEEFSFYHMKSHCARLISSIKSLDFINSLCRSCIQNSKWPRIFRLFKYIIILFKYMHQYQTMRKHMHQYQTMRKFSVSY